MKKKPERRAELPERIVAAAVKLSDGLVVLGRHGAHGDGHQELNKALLARKLDLTGMKSGFLASDGRWVDRYDARRVAYSAGQLEHKMLAGPTGELYSGDWED